jgi:ATP-binding cassette, subfamily F, member 2
MSSKQPQKGKRKFELQVVLNGASTPLTSISGMNSKAASTEDLMSMAKLNLATERYACFFRSCWILILFYCCRSATGVLVSDVKGRDIKIDWYTLSVHGRLLIEGAEIALNYGQRYGLLGENGSGKVRMLFLVFIFLIS